MVGRLNDKAILSGVGLGSTMQAFIGYMAIMGLKSAFDTLISQAAGAGNFELCGKYLNRGRFILCCMFVPIAALLCFTEEILLATGQDIRVSYFAGLYVRCYLPGLFLHVMNDIQRRFLNALG